MSFFDHRLFEQLRKESGVTWGRPVRALESCRSTNDLALSAIDTQAKTGIVFLAHEQTAGRGRRGNTWTAPPGECLMFSTLLRYPPSQTGLQGLSLAVGLALLDATQVMIGASEVHTKTEGLQPTSLRPLIKWPNDLYLSDKKLAGVLIESRKNAAEGWGVVVGVGLNLTTLIFPPELSGATSLLQCGVRPPGLETLLVLVLKHIEKRMMQFLTRGCAAIVKEVRDFDYLRARLLKVGNVKGRGAGLTDQGSLLVETKGGKLHTLRSGHVELLAQTTI